MSGTVTIHVHAGYRAVHLLLGTEAITADPPYPGGRVVTAGELTVPAARFSPERLAQRFPRAAWEAFWDTTSRTPGRYAAFHPQRGPLEGHHTNRWLEHPLTSGWQWAVEGEQVAEVRAAFAAAAARARADVVADALAAADPEHRFDSTMDLAGARARAGAVVVHDGPWVLSWDGGNGYTLETLHTGLALAVTDQISYATPAPPGWMLHPWAAAHGWNAVMNANPRLKDWLDDAASVGPGRGPARTPADPHYPVGLGPAPALGLVRPRTDPDREVDEALFEDWREAVAVALPGCVLVNHATGPQQWSNDPDQAVLIGPHDTDMQRVRAAGQAAAEALGWTGPAHLGAARELPPAALAAAAAVVRAGLEHQIAAQAEAAAEARYADATQDYARAIHPSGTGTTADAPPPPGLAGPWLAHLEAGTHAAAADQRRVDTWRAATGHGFTVAQVAALDATVTAGQVLTALHAPPPAPPEPGRSAVEELRAVMDQLAARGVVSRPRMATPPAAGGTAAQAAVPPARHGGPGISR